MASYDFVFQPLVATAPLDAGPLLAALTADGATQRPDGPWVWRLTAGDVVLAPLNEGGRLVGYDLKVPFSEKTELVTEALKRGTALAQDCQLQLIDPQLSKVVRAGDAGAVEASFLRLARYAGAYMGVSEAVGAAWPAESASEGLTVPTKVLLAVLVFAAALYFAFQMVSRVGPSAPLPERPESRRTVQPE